MQKYVVCRIQFCLMFLSFFGDSGRLDRSNKVVLVKKVLEKLEKLKSHFWVFSNDSRRLKIVNCQVLNFA